MDKVRIIDLFSGIGGIRKGFELACADEGIECECVYSSEIKYAALKVFHQNHPMEGIAGDITKVDANTVPDFDVLLAGFPCQAFSSAGKRLGFMDTRGTLFFDVERILAAKKPLGFVLENVEGLVNHDKADRKKPIGRTLETILQHLEALGYKISWRILNARNFGVPQERKRIYIVGSRKDMPCLDDFPLTGKKLGDILEKGKPLDESEFVQNLLSHYSVNELKGRSIKDKRGGEDNIHSWDLEMKGPVSSTQKKLLNAMLKERRKKKWAQEYGIDWMDGMPLTLDMIRTFFDDPCLEEMLEDLAQKRYVVKEHPKALVDGRRVQDESLPVGYNIVAGKMSFRVNKVLDPDDVAPTLVAMDMQHLYVPDGKGIRPLTMREGLRLFGYPDDFKFVDLTIAEGYDLLGNTVVVPVIKAVSKKLLEVL